MSSPAIKLAPERHAQIKAIGARLGLSISETVAYLINGEIDKGTIPEDIEGIMIEVEKDSVLIAFDDLPPVRLSLEGAQRLGNTLCEFADGSKRAQKLANMQDDYLIERKGNGVKLTIPLSGKVTKSFPRDLAHDIGDLLFRSAAYYAE